MKVPGGGRPRGLIQMFCQTTATNVNNLHRVVTCYAAAEAVLCSLHRCSLASALRGCEPQAVCDALRCLAGGCFASRLRWARFCCTWIWHMGGASAACTHRQFDILPHWLPTDTHLGERPMQALHSRLLCCHCCLACGLGSAIQVFGPGHAASWHPMS
jgi:hypothetical protein